MTSITRFFRTLRHLQGRQVRARLRRALRARGGAVPDQATISQPPSIRSSWGHAPVPTHPSARSQSSSALAEGTFTFVNETHALRWLPDWSGAPQATRLWTYNLHYFEWLWDLDFEHARDAVQHWIQCYPARRRSPGWAPYPSSLRIQNWTLFFFGKHREQTLADPAFTTAVYASLLRQSTWLAANLETDLLANHYLENGVALAVFGACFDTPAAGSKRNQSLAILREQLPEQILSDGVHFERSPMYHVRTLYALELLMGTGDEDVVDAVRPFRDRMSDATPLLTHPDGGIALLNDSAFGIYPPPGRFAPSYDDTMGAFALPQAGYYGWRRGGDYLICDAGPLGPEYNLAHAHGDILSFELSLDGHRIFVDAGTHGYDDSPLRAYCRSTEAHNTASVEGLDQAEFWGTFRVGRRPEPQDVRFSPETNGFTLRAAHDGYAQLAGARHKRTFNWQDGGPLVIVDETSAQQLVRVNIYFHLHPECQVVSMSRTQANIHTPAGRITLTVPAGGKLLETQYAYCPEFNQSHEATVITVRAVGSRTRIVTTIARTKEG